MKLTPPAKTNPEPKTSELYPDALKYDTNFKDIDSILGEMATPKQDFTPKVSINENQEPSPGVHAGAAPGVYDPTNPETSNPQPTTPEANARAGKANAEALDLVASLLLMLIAGTKDRSQFSATPEQKQEIGEALSEYTKDKPFNTPPWLTLAILIGVAYVPAGFEAAKMRKMNAQESRLDILEKKLNNQTNDSIESED